MTKRELICIVGQMGMKNPVGVFLIMKRVEGRTLATIGPIR
jgi:hypothetical protein